MPSSRPAVRFQDVLENVQLIRSYLKGMDQAAFDAAGGPEMPWSGALNASAKRPASWARRQSGLHQGGPGTQCDRSETSCGTPNPPG